MKAAFKKKLFERCMQQVDEKITMSREAIQDVAETAEDATKSSAGDKYETTVAMMQIERDKYEERLQEALKQKKVLKQVDLTQPAGPAQFGSLVYTNLGTFFIATSLGVLTVDEEKIFVVSLTSPIGQALNQQPSGTEFSFNGKLLKISQIY